MWGIRKGCWSSLITHAIFSLSILFSRVRFRQHKIDIQFIISLPTCLSYFLFHQTGILFLFSTGLQKQNHILHGARLLNFIWNFEKKIANAQRKRQIEIPWIEEWAQDCFFLFDRFSYSFTLFLLSQQQLLRRIHEDAFSFLLSLHFGEHFLFHV